jgi:hypothetical protein
MPYQRFRFKNKVQAEECVNAFSVSPAIAREVKEYKHLGDNYPFTEPWTNDKMPEGRRR